jgi:hypothetical protein
MTPRAISARGTTTRLLGRSISRTGNWMHLKASSQNQIARKIISKNAALARHRPLWVSVAPEPQSPFESSESVDPSVHLTKIHSKKVDNASLSEKIGGQSAQLAR